MSDLIFKRINHDWNADPNAPHAGVAAFGARLQLTFLLNSWLYDASEGEKGRLTFTGCSLWRSGPTNDEGWYAGQCRYSKIAPAWGEFYELTGEDGRRLDPSDWHEIAPLTREGRHFLFYLRDHTFECFADEWRFERGG